MVGNKPNYQKEDVIRVFLKIKEHPISRQELVKKTKLGEGTIRSILDILKRKKLIVSNKKGHMISNFGKKKKQKFNELVEGPKKIQLQTYKGMKSCGMLVKKPGNTRIGFEQRDEAIRKGAYSAIIFRYENKLKIPGSEIDFKKEYRDDYDKIMSNFDLKKHNILIVTFSKNHSICENSAIAVANRIRRISL